MIARLMNAFTTFFEDREVWADRMIRRDLQASPRPGAFHQNAA